MIFYAILFSILQVCIAQLIVDDITSTCNYDLNHKNIRVYGDVWNITKFGKQYIFSLCQAVSSPYCDSDALACVYDARVPKDSVRNAGKRFEVFQMVVDNKSKDFLKTVDGLPCRGGLYGNFTFIFEFDMSHSAKVKYHLQDATDCELHLVIYPNFEPPCMKNVDGNLVSLEHFRNEEFLIDGNDRKFAVSLCGAARSCRNSSVSVCELQGNHVTALGNLESQHIVYYAGELLVKSHVGVDKRFRKFIEIHVKCNWGVSKANAKFLKLQKQTYKFQLESSSACVKMPANCVTRDIENYTYDLKKLYKPKGFWNVRNVSEGSLYINICGPLKTTKNCATYSQVCQVRQQKVLNYGSIFSNLKAMYETLTAEFIAGETCSINKSLQLSTNIQFECASVEKGPVLTKSNGCTYEILWETPQACPKFISQGSECQIKDLLGYRDLTKLTTSDRKHQLSKNVYLFYNFCGDLKRTCNNFTGISLCLVINTQEYVIGWTNKQIDSDDGMLSMKLKGEKHQNWFRNATVLFRCSYSSPQEGTVNVKIIQEHSAYEITVLTPLACSSLHILDCQITYGRDYYDLTPLIQSKRNKIVKIGNLEYILNICRPLIADKNSLCSMGNVSSCLRNVTEPNMKRRYMSLGTLQAPTIENNKLIIKYTGGEFCLKSLDYWSTTIRFQCASNENEPKLLTQSECSYEFIWRTKAACAKRYRTRSPQICELHDTISGRKFDFTQSNHTSLIFVDQNNVNFQFDICNNVYKLKESNNTFVKQLAKSQFERQGNHYVLKYTLNEACNDTNTNLHLQIHFKCVNDSKENFEYLYFRDCFINFMFKSRIVCTLKDFFPNHETSMLTYDDRNHCLVTNDFVSFNLTSITPITVISETTNTKYHIGFGTNNNCSRLLCSNSTELVNSCPSIQYVKEDALVKLKFASTRECGEGYFNTQLWLRCNSSFQPPRILKETKCLVFLEYPTKIACNLLQIVPIPSTGNTSTIVSSCSISLIAVLVAVAFALWYRKRRHYNCINKNQVPVYMRVN